MSRKRTCTAIILRTMEIGEADLFCIVLTREYGRLAARARGVRRSLSVLPALLPGRTFTMELRESGSAFTIASANPVTDVLPLERDLRAFLHFQHAAEALLLLLHDDEPLPDVFDDLQRYLRLCAACEDPFPVYALRLLATLGLLPLTTDDRRFAQLSTLARATVEAAAKSATWSGTASVTCTPQARLFAEALLAEHATRVPRVADVARQLTVDAATAAQSTSAWR